MPKRKIINVSSYLDRVCHTSFKVENISEKLNRIIADKVGIGVGDYVLDVSCNEGEDAVWLGTAFPGVKVHGISLSARHVRVAGKAAQKKRLQFVDFSFGDPCSTNFPDAHFTVVWANYYHPSRKIDFYKEACRVLKPGGRLIIANTFRKSNLFSLQDELLFRKVLASWTSPGPDTWEEHYKNIVQAGFARFQMQDMSALLERVLKECIESSEKTRSLWKRFRQTILKREGSYHIAGAAQQYEAFKKGLWTYGMVFAIKP